MEDFSYNVTVRTLEAAQQNIPKPWTLSSKTRFSPWVENNTLYRGTTLFLNTLETSVAMLIL